MLPADAGAAAIYNDAAVSYVAALYEFKVVCAMLTIVADNPLDVLLVVSYTVVLPPNLANTPPLIDNEVELEYGSDGI